jgi:hypothetical protein
MNCKLKSNVPIKKTGSDRSHHSSNLSGQFKHQHPNLITLDSVLQKLKLLQHIGNLLTHSIMEAPQATPAPASAALRECQLCDLKFDTAEEKREHAKSEWQ